MKLPNQLQSSPSIRLRPLPTVNTTGVTESAAEAQSMADAGQAMVKAAARLQTRQDVVERAKAVSRYKLEMNEELRRLQTEADLSDGTVVQAFGEKLAQRQEELISRFPGSQTGKSELFVQLEGLRTSLSDKVGALSAATSISNVEDLLGSEQSEMAARVADNPASLNDEMNQWGDVVDSYAAALPPEKEMSWRKAGMAAAASSVVERMLGRGDPDAAKQALMSPGVTGHLSSEKIQSFGNRIAKAQAEKNKIVREAQAKLKAAEIIQGGPLSPGQRLNAANAFLGVSASNQAKDEFNRNLDELMALEEAGEQGSARYQWLSKRMEKQTKSTDQGLIIQFGPDGTVSAIAQGPAGGLGSTLTGARALDEKASVDRLGTVIDLLDETTAMIEESPTRAGITGSFRSFAQKVAGVAADVSPDAVANVVGESARQFGLGEFFDPTLPEMEIYENTIALELAKMRVTSGGGGIRAIESAFRNAKKDVAIRGMTSSKEALTRLQTVRREFEIERRKLIQRLSGNESPEPGVTATNPETGERMIYRNGNWEKM